MDPSIWGLPCEVVVICLYFLELKLVFSFTFFGEGDVTGQIFQFVSESKYLFNISKHFSDQMVGYWLLSWSRKQIKWNGSSTANVKSFYFLKIFSFFTTDFFFFTKHFSFFTKDLFVFLLKIFSICVPEGRNQLPVYFWPGRLLISLYYSLFIIRSFFIRSHFIQFTYFVCNVFLRVHNWSLNF